MSYKRIKRSVPFFKLLLKSTKSNSERLNLLRRFPDFVTNDIVEILYNVIRGNVKVSIKNRQVLFKQKGKMLQLVKVVANKKLR